MEKISFTDFKAFFEENIDRRSRTASGVSNTATSKTKQALLKTGEDLKIQVKKNTERLIESVWEHRMLNPTIPRHIKFIDTQWNIIINRDLIAEYAYASEYEELERESEQVEKRTGVKHTINKLFRVWDVRYATLRAPPVELDTIMDSFYANLAGKINLYKNGLFHQSELLAYADFVIDKAIHPWRDGCGRNATAMVMWLSLLQPDASLPLFGSREKHHAAMENLSLHTLYFLSCLNHEFQ
ncbi:MAG: hypothetical protein HYT37_03560 [Candidatus Sungbacteria bacterium]|nr:hypothetical protein [Candidatus Sungbacteria bacterium]